MVYSSTASPSTTLAYKVLPSLSVSVLPFSLNTTLSLFILSPLESSIFAFSVIVCPALAVIVFSYSVIVAFPLVIVMLVVLVRDDLYGFSIDFYCYFCSTYECFSCFITDCCFYRGFTICGCYVFWCDGGCFLR